MLIDGLERGKEKEGYMHHWCLNVTLDLGMVLDAVVMLWRHNQRQLEVALY